MRAAAWTVVLAAATAAAGATIRAQGAAKAGEAAGVTARAAVEETAAAAAGATTSARATAAATAAAMAMLMVTAAVEDTATVAAGITVAAAATTQAVVGTETWEEHMAKMKQGDEWDQLRLLLFQTRNDCHDGRGAASAAGDSQWIHAITEYHLPFGQEKWSDRYLRKHGGLEFWGHGCGDGSGNGYIDGYGGGEGKFGGYRSAGRFGDGPGKSFGLGDRDARPTSCRGKYMWKTGYGGGTAPYERDDENKQHDD